MFRYRDPQGKYEAVILKGTWVKSQGLEFQQDVGRISSIVNEAYSVGEDGIWTGAVTRAKDADVLAKMQEEKLMVLLKSSNDDSGGFNGSSSSGRRIASDCVGCIQVDSELGDGRLGLGMFAVDSRERGSGLGKLLMRASETFAVTKGSVALRLELLSPRDHEHTFKARLDRWYTSMGFATDRDDKFSWFEKEFPELVEKLAVPCKVHFYEKILRSS